MKLQKALLICVSTVLGTTLNGQQVSTYLAGPTGIDDGIFRSSDGKLYGASFDGGALYQFSNLAAVLLTDTMVNTTEISGDSQGNIYACDHGGNRVYKMDSGGNVSTFISGIGKAAGILKLPGSDTLLISSNTTHSIYKVAPDGVYTQWLTGGSLSWPVSMQFDAQGNLYVGNYYSGKILKVDPSLNMTELCTINTNSLGHMVIKGNFLYVTTVFSHRIYKVDITNGNATLFAGSSQGSQNGPIATATFNTPNGILLSQTGDSLLISEYNTNSIRLISGLNSSVSVPEEISCKEVDIYPVPTRDDLFIKTGNGRTPGVQIYDNGGRLLREFSKETLHENGVQRIRPELPPGHYRLNLIFVDEIQSRALIIM